MAKQPCDNCFKYSNWWWNVW